jgi:hypothetical protein
MKKQNHLLLHPFQMKRKLSNARQIHWIIAFFVLIGIGFSFIFAEFVKMYDRKVLYYNFKTVHLPSRKKKIAAATPNIEVVVKKKGKKYHVLLPVNYIENISVMDNHSAAFFVYEDKIVFGTVESLLLPKLEKDSLVLDIKSYIQEFKEKSPRYKNFSEIFPSQTIGIAFDPRLEDKLTYEEKINMIGELYSLIWQENTKFKAPWTKPSVVLMETISS